MERKLKGKVALIMGGACGLGRGYPRSDGTLRAEAAVARNLRHALPQLTGA